VGYSDVVSVPKILAAMRNNPKGIRFADAMKMAKHYFGQPRRVRAPAITFLEAGRQVPVS
jgi:hypothetical protein